MIDAEIGETGIRFRASEESSAFVEALRSEYATELRQRAEWPAKYLQAHSDDQLAALISDRIGRWAVEFQGEAGRPLP